MQSYAKRNMSPSRDRASTGNAHLLAVGAVVLLLFVVLASGEALRARVPVSSADPPAATPTSDFVTEGVLETAEQAQALAMSLLPNDYTPTEVVIRLARADTIEDIMPNTTAGWDDHTPVWAVIMRTPGLVAHDVIPVPVVVTDTTPVIGVAHFFDAPSGLFVANVAITSETEFQEYVSLPHESLPITAATIAPPPIVEP